MTAAVSEILKQAEPLSTDEQLIVAVMVIEQARKKAAASTARYKWLDVMGAAPYPLVGEDAQAWVTRIRQEGDEVMSAGCEALLTNDAQLKRVTELQILVLDDLEI